MNPLLKIVPAGVIWTISRISRKVANRSASLLRGFDRHGTLKSGPVPMTIGDVKFDLCLPSSRLKGPNYRRLSSEGSIYEPVMVACLTHALQHASRPRFMDIGAHVGYYSCYVSALLAGREEVYAIESNPLYAEAARQAAHLNGFDRMRVFQAVLSNRVEAVKIHGTAVSHDSGPGDTTTLTVTLDSLCEREQLQPTIVKMDVHGAEGKVLLGMPKVLDRVDFFLLELHKLLWLDMYSPGVTRTAMLDLLEDRGLTLYQVAGHRGTDSASFPELLSGRGFWYRRLDRPTRNLMLFEAEDAFVLGLRRQDIGSLLGPNSPPANI